MKTNLFSLLGAAAIVINTAYAPTTQANTTTTANPITQIATPQFDCKVSQTPVPVPAGVQTRRIAPATTNPAITGAPDCPHYVALSQTARRQPELFVFLPGTNIEPLQDQLIVNQAALNGYYAIGLSYQNLLSEHNACEKPLNQLPEDPQCSTDFRKEVITGVDTSAVVTVTASNSIVFRLRSLLVYLDTQQPNEGWGQFLLNGGDLAWSKLRFGGHSQGSGHTGFIAAQREVARACMFAGPGDNARYGLTPPPSGISVTVPFSTPNGVLQMYHVPATWVTSTTATPAQRLFAFAHQRDFEPPKALNWDLLGISDIAGIANVDGELPPFGGAHALTTTHPMSNAHSGVINDDDTPRTVSGLPLFAPVWQTLCFANHPNPEPDPDNTCQNQCRDLGDAPDSNNSLGNPMSIHPFGLIAQPANFPTEFTGAAGTGPIHLNAGSNMNPNGVPLTAIDSALGLEVNPAGNLASRVSNERNAFLLPDQDIRKRNIIPAPNPANGRSNRDGYDNAFVSPAGAPLALKFTACQPTTIQYAQYIHGPWAMNGFYTGTRYINVWADFNRDGDWADSNLGAACPEFPNASVNEWFVRNLPAPNASGIFVLPPQLFPNNTSTRPFWLRISISETPAPANSAGNGPAVGYRFGETEDHLLCYRQAVGLWGDCPMLQLHRDNPNNPLDGDVQVPFNKPITFTVDILEDATYPVTVTWTIDGSSVSQIGGDPKESAAKSPQGTDGRLIITRVVPSPVTPRDAVTLGWYGCITCTLHAEGTVAINLSPTTISVKMIDVDGNEAGDEAIVTVGTRVFMPMVQK